MLTRLKVTGFKNLVDVDVRFGPFTCIAGANGVGKSNLFDAIHFLSSLANSSFIEAAQSVRDEKGRAPSIRNLFHRTGSEYAPEMAFTVEMIVPSEGKDDLEQPARATSTFLRYSVTLAYRVDEERSTLGSLELLTEELTHITVGDARSNLPFLPREAVAWRTSTVQNKRTAPSYISTDDSGTDRIIKLHQDSKGDQSARGRAIPRLAVNLPRTVLSTINTNENPTALLAKREMESWRLLQLEPSSLRGPDGFTSKTRLGMDGSNLASTLYHLARSHKNGSHNGATVGNDPEQVYAQLANRISQLIADVRQIYVDRNEVRELLTLHMTDADGTTHPAQALSDGTLRFLALAVLELDPTQQGVLCLEEPENGIHPARIPAMLKLLEDIAVDVNDPVGVDNPLRQVLINTHSPTVVLQVPADSLIIADLKETVTSGQRFKCANFSCLPDTWRASAGMPVVPIGDLLAYLNPVEREEDQGQRNEQNVIQPLVKLKNGKRRVINQPYLQPYLPLWEEAE